ncbi:MAG: VOC family protein [Bacteroidota bacterium]
MKKIYILVFITLWIISCNTRPSNQTDEQTAPILEKAIDTTPKITGIGGIFFKAENPDQVKEWYNKNLGLKVDDFGAPFEFRNANRPDETNYLNWDAFVDSTSYFNPSQKQFMINYRVQNLEGLVRNLKQNGVTILDEMVTVEYGKFIHIMDLEGNKIELWEPVDSVLMQLGRDANK